MTGRYNRAKKFADVLGDIAPVQKSPHALSTVASRLIEHGKTTQPILEEARPLPF